VIQPVMMEAFEHLNIPEPYLIATVDQILLLRRIVKKVAILDLPPT
jgi:hypothetical protein